MKTCYLQFTKIYKRKELTGKTRKEQSFVGAPKNSCSGNFLHIKQKKIMLVLVLRSVADNQATSEAAIQSCL